MQTCFTDRFRQMSLAGNRVDADRTDLANGVQCTKAEVVDGMSVDFCCCCQGTLLLRTRRHTDLTGLPPKDSRRWPPCYFHFMLHYIS